MKKHSTIIIAWDSAGVVQYCRTFDYEEEKEAALNVYSFVSQNYPRWVMSDVGHYLHMDNFKNEKITR
ncbi:MAG TPA: hypothetical protein VD884_13225 [Ohtaekwangia sp.]|nr:hypothetical protein [Ohtaekwangia sp.]